MKRSEDWKRNSLMAVSIDNLNIYRNQSVKEQLVNKDDILCNIEALFKFNPKMSMQLYRDILKNIIIFPEITYLTIKYLKPR